MRLGRAIPIPFVAMANILVQSVRLLHLIKCCVIFVVAKFKFLSYGDETFNIL